MRRWKSIAFAFTFAFGSTVAAAGRPDDAIDADRVAAQSDIADLERRMRSIEEQLALRRGALKQRVRALYKMSHGGYLRLVFDRRGGPELLRRQAVVRRVLMRDLSELGTLCEEAKQLGDEQARRSNRIAHALDLDRQLALARPNDVGNSSMAHKRGHLERPVSGAIIGEFGPYRDAELRLELVRRGVELGTRAGQTVRAVAPGRVAWIGQVRGLGRAVAIDHGEGFISLTARLSAVSVEVGQGVEAQMPIGDADGKRVYFELAQDRTPLNPAAWLSPRH